MKHPKTFKVNSGINTASHQAYFCRGYGTCLAAAVRAGASDIGRIAEGYTLQQFADAGLNTFDLQLIAANWDK